jgi:hypothetical protein
MIGSWIRCLAGITLILALQACASEGLPAAGDRIPIPGGMYSWGVDQRAEDFADVEIAQSQLLMWKDSRMWRPLTPTSVALARVLGLQRYYVMQARWKLKDGREFILESIDTGALVQEYFRAHGLIKTAWERENRTPTVGDSSPILVHDIKGDTLRLKWVLTINRTPAHARLRADGAANPWATEREEQLIAVIKGVPASGLDFKTLYEPRK